MILKLKYPVLLLILSVIFYSCEKEYSLEGNVPASTAVFTYTGFPGACTNVVVTGDYQSGVALGAANTVTIAVDVTTIGSYTLTTDAVNGISFAGSGSFTATGTQTIILTGAGIPVASGTFSFTPGTNGCSFPVTVTGGGTSVFTYDGGTGNACTAAPTAGTFTAGIPVAASNTVTINVTVTTPGSWSVSTPLVNGISFSGSGNFAAAIAQTITLTAAGTPLADGTFNFIPSNNGCSFPVIVQPALPAGDFFSCTIDGVAKTFNIDLSVEKIGSDTLNITGSESSDANSAIFAIGLTKLPMVTAGTYDRYLMPTNTATFCVGAFLDGASITPWLTGLLATTDGFTTIVTNITANKIVGTFSGTLYSDPAAGTGPKVVTAGQFSVSF